MGNCLSFRIVFPLQNSSRPPIVEYCDECLICLRITSCWKKLHPSDGDQPPHLVCTDCRTNLLKHSSQPNCPLCLRHIYTLSLSFYYRCFCCNQIKKCVNSSTHPHVKCHQNLGHFVCNHCAQEKHNCPICLKKINPHDVWSESSKTMHPIYFPNPYSSLLHHHSLCWPPHRSPPPSPHLTTLHH